MGSFTLLAVPITLHGTITLVETARHSFWAICLPSFAVNPSLIIGKMELQNKIRCRYLIIDILSFRFVHEAISGGFREVVDGTGYIVATHIKHGYDSPDGKSVTKSDSASTFWQKSKDSNWQIYHNLALSVQYGSYRNQLGQPLHAPWKLQTCIEPNGSPFPCMQRRKRPGKCPCEYVSDAVATQSDPTPTVVVENGKERKLMKCGGISPDRKYHVDAQVQPGHAPTYGLPFTLPDVLS